MDEYNVSCLGELTPTIFNQYIASGLSATHFYMPEDTDAFCRLVGKSVNENDIVADLGCGDGIATIHAIECGGKRALGVDISQSALYSTLENWEKCSIKNNKDVNLEVIQKDMVEFLETEAIIPYSYSRKIDLIVSNPPYIPVGNSDAASTVNGGPDGLRFISPLIEKSARVSRRLSWLQGSFSNPLKALRLLNENHWKPLEILAYAVKFRQNAQKQAPYLETLRKNNQAFFYTEIDQYTRWFLKLGIACSKSSNLSLQTSNKIEESLFDLLSIFDEYGPYCEEEICKIKFPIPVEYGVYPK